MSSLWLKIKVWSKIVVFALLAIYTLVFLLKNGDRTTPFWWWYNRDNTLPVLWLVFFAFLAGVVGTILLRTTFKTIRQFREMRARGASEQLAREVAEMKAKEARAATMQTKPTSGDVI